MGIMGMTREEVVAEMLADRRALRAALSHIDELEKALEPEQGRQIKGGMRIAVEKSILNEKDQPVFAVRREEADTARMVREHIRIAKHDWFLIGNCSGMTIGIGLTLGFFFLKGIW